MLSGGLLVAVAKYDFRSICLVNTYLKLILGVSISWYVSERIKIVWSKVETKPSVESRIEFPTCHIICIKSIRGYQTKIDITHTCSTSKRKSCLVITTSPPQAFRWVDTHTKWTILVDTICRIGNASILTRSLTSRTWVVF